MERKNAWNTYDENAMKELEQVTEQYRRFISEGKTERECAQLTVEMAKEHGYISLEEAVASGRQLKAGDKTGGTFRDRYRANGERYEYSGCPY